MTDSPFDKLSKFSERKLTITLLVSLVIAIATMSYFDNFLKNASCPNGIVSFELAKELTVSKQILESWSSVAKTACGLSMGFDYLFLILYSTFIALLIHKLNVRLWKGTLMYNIGVAFIYFQFLAALFDAIENVGLIQLLLGNLKQFWTSIAYWFAILKFSLIGLGILYVLLNFGYFHYRKRKLRIH